MKLWITETEKVKRQAEEEAVVILQHWRQKVRRLRLYRACLCAVLILACLGLMGYSYYLVDSSIPSVIYMRAESEESLALDIPAKGEILSVSEQGTSNIPDGAVTIDLSRPLTLKTGNADNLQMQVKLFGILPFKQVGIRVIEDRELIPVGVPIGIYVKTEGVLVVGTGEFASQGAGKVSPAKNILKSGDYVIKLNGTEVTGKDDLITRIENCGGEQQILTIRRNAETYDVRIKPERDRTGKYKIGVWVRDKDHIALFDHSVAIVRGVETDAVGHGRFGKILGGNGHMAILAVDIDHFEIDHLDALLTNELHDLLCRFSHWELPPKFMVRLSEPPCRDRPPR